MCSRHHGIQECKWRKAMKQKQVKTSCWDYLWYALYAFAGLGAELVLLSVFEPLLFKGIKPADYSTLQHIVHWMLTILCWAVISLFLVRRSKQKLGFDLLGHSLPSKQGCIIAALLVAACVTLNALDWQTLKIAGEFQKKGPVLFGFQYLYYMFEVGLVFLIVAFGQKFAEELLKKRSNIPFGGVVLCFTWGVIHMLSKGSLFTGLGVMAFALCYGFMYVLLNRNAKYSYLAMLFAFII